MTSSWDYYEPLENILGNKPATHPSVVTDSYADSVRVDDEIDNADVDGDTTLASTMTSDSEERQGTSTAFTSTDPKIVNKARDVKDTSVLRKKKVKKWQIDVLQESFKDVVEHIIEAQKISDKMFADLEEKTLKLEEAQLE